MTFFNSALFKQNSLQPINDSFLMKTYSKKRKHAPFTPNHSINNDIITCTTKKSSIKNFFQIKDGSYLPIKKQKTSQTSIESKIDMSINGGVSNELNLTQSYLDLGQVLSKFQNF